MLVPTVVEADGRVERAFDIYSRLLRDRIVFLGREVEEDIANVIVAQLLLLEADDPDADVSLYVNSPGGSAYAGMAIYDAMPARSAGRADDLLRHGHVGGGDDRGRRRSGEAVRAAEREAHDPPGLGGLPGHPGGHRHRRARGARQPPGRWRRSSPVTLAATSSACWKTSIATAS